MLFMSIGYIHINRYRSSQKDVGKLSLRYQHLKKENKILRNRVEGLTDSYPSKPRGLKIVKKKIGLGS